MSKLSNEAYEFRGRLLNEGGHLTKVLVMCLEKDPSATNQTIQTIYDNHGGELTFMSTLILANACKWIMQGKPDTLADEDLITFGAVKEAMRAAI